MPQDISERQPAEGSLKRSESLLADAQQIAHINRAHAQALIQQSEARFRAFMDNSPAVAFMKDRNGRLVYLNAEFARRVVPPGQDWLGKTTSELFPAEIAAKLEENDRYVLSSGQARECIEITPDCNGRLTHWLVHKFPFRDLTGQDHLAGQAIDITDQIRDREALRESEAQVRLLLESTAEAIYGLDVDGKCTYCNPACVRLLGYRDSADLLGQSMHVLIHRTHRDGTSYPVESCPVLRAVLRGVEFHSHVEVLWRADGSSFPAEYWSHPVRRDGQIVGAVVTFQDITERERLERKILEASEMERQRIGQDLHDDLCQQLTGIAFTARLLQQRLMRRTPAAAAIAEAIVRNVQQTTVRARELAKGLNPVRLEAEGLPAALRELAANVEMLFGVRCRFRCRGAREATRVTEPAVAIQLYRIAQEAATNSVKHGKAKKISIYLSMVKGRPTLSVADDGVGISDDRPKTGMGLPVMNQRARVIGAALTIAHRRRGGTLVTCSLGGAAFARDPPGGDEDHARRKTGENTRAAGGRSPHDPARAGRPDP